MAVWNTIEPVRNWSAPHFAGPGNLRSSRLSAGHGNRSVSLWLTALASWNPQKLSTKNKLPRKMPQGYDISVRYWLNQDGRVFGHKFQPLWSQVAVANDPMAAAAAKVWPKNTCGSWRGERGRSWKAKTSQVFWGCYKRDLPSCHISHLGKRLVTQGSSI